MENSLKYKIEEANKRISGHLLVTPLMESHWLSSNSQSRVFCKLESEQVTGSFKARGALNKILSLSDDALSKGIVTASTGNHALAVTNAIKIA